jgi:predicted phosphodiesterase
MTKRHMIVDVRLQVVDVTGHEHELAAPFTEALCVCPGELSMSIMQIRRFIDYLHLHCVHRCVN